LLKIPYFRFVSPKDRYLRITEHIFVVKKKKPTYLPTSKIVGRVRGNRNIFNCGLRAISEKIYGWGGWKTLFLLTHQPYKFQLTFSCNYLPPPY
jgi:hypothetical protein